MPTAAAPADEVTSVAPARMRATMEFRLNPHLEPMLKRHQGLRASVRWCVSTGHKITGLATGTAGADAAAAADDQNVHVNPPISPGR